MSSGSIGDPARGGDSSENGDRQPGGHDNVLPPMLQILGMVWKDVLYSHARDGVEVLDKLLAVMGSGGHLPRWCKGGVRSGLGGVGGGEGGGAGA